MPIDQTVVGVGNDRANCFQACLAMISGLPLADCIDITDPAVEDMWVDAVIEWAATYGWAFKTGVRPPTDRPCIANGPTADRKGVHGVVCEGGVLFHDPHPSRSGIVSVNWYGWLEPLSEAPAVWDAAIREAAETVLKIDLSGFRIGEAQALIHHRICALARAPRDRDGSGEAGQTAKQAGPAGQQPGPEGDRHE